MICCTDPVGSGDDVTGRIAAMVPAGAGRTTVCGGLRGGFEAAQPRTGSARHSPSIRLKTGRTVPHGDDNLNMLDVNMLARKGEHCKMQVFLAEAFFVV